ncbi:MAG: phytanoyl-CoA dioxygenase family protein [Planctomycetota bacterium]|nr:phytanoyl-CoA dioxygenase family protein [Planctomycetota bacterium]
MPSFLLLAMASIALTTEQHEDYACKGYLIVHGVLTEREVLAFLKHEAEPKPESMQKGLLSHTSDPMWDYIARHPNIAGIAQQLLNGRTRIVQTMYLAKHPADTNGDGGGRGIAIHQDTHYLPSEPNTLMACWIAMNDTGPDNGGFCVLPGSHRGALRNTRKNDDDDHLSWEKEHLMRDRTGREWEQTMYSFQIEDLNDDEIERLTIPRCSAVFFSGMTVHGSFANHSTRPRLAFAVHYIHEDSWLLRADVQETALVSDFAAGLPESVK